MKIGSSSCLYEIFTGSVIMARVFNNQSSTDATIRAIDRKREQERRFMLSQAFKNADEISTKLVQRLIDRHIIETTSEQAMRDLFSEQLRTLANMEEFDIQFKIAPLRNLATDPNFISLFLTQYIIEDLIDHPKVQDVFGDDLDIYKAVDSILNKIRPT
jgi:hydroxypyruvate isomerase